METTNAPAVSGPQLVTGPTPTLLELQGIRKVFYTDEVETHALSDVHLAVKKGEWLAIVGPSPSVVLRRTRCPRNGFAVLRTASALRVREL